MCDQELEDAQQISDDKADLARDERRYSKFVVNEKLWNKGVAERFAEQARNERDEEERNRTAQGFHKCLLIRPVRTHKRKFWSWRMLYGPHGQRTASRPKKEVVLRKATLRVLSNRTRKENNSRKNFAVQEEVEKMRLER